MSDRCLCLPAAQSRLVLDLCIMGSWRLYFSKLQNIADWVTTSNHLAPFTPAVAELSRCGILICQGSVLFQTHQSGLRIGTNEDDGQCPLTAVYFQQLTPFICFVIGPAGVTCCWKNLNLGAKWLQTNPKSLCETTSSSVIHHRLKTCHMLSFWKHTRSKHVKLMTL